MSVMPINNTAEGNAGFSTGIDALDGILSGYFAFENFKQGKELADAQLQQARLENSVNTQQQINEPINKGFFESVKSGSAGVYALVGLGLVGAVLLLKAKK